MKAELTPQRFERLIKEFGVRKTLAMMLILVDAPLSCLRSPEEVAAIEGEASRSRWQDNKDAIIATGVGEFTQYYDRQLAVLNAKVAKLAQRSSEDTKPQPPTSKADRPIVMLKDQMRRWFDLPDDAPPMTFTQSIKMAEGSTHDRGGREFAAQFAEKLAYIVDSAVT